MPILAPGYGPADQRAYQLPTTGAGVLDGEARNQRDHTGPEGRVGRAVAHEQHGEDQADGQYEDRQPPPDQGPVHVHMHGLQILAYRQELHAHGHGEIKERRGQNGGQHDHGVGPADESRHHEGRGSHDRRHELAAVAEQARMPPASSTE